MAFNQTQFFEDLEKLTTKFIEKNKKEDFIFDFLTLLDVSKSTITSLKKMTVVSMSQPILKLARLPISIASTSSLSLKAKTLLKP